MDNKTITSRAAILPYPADPFLLNFWLRGFKNIWYGEVDRLYIYCNSPIESEVIDFIKEISEDPKITLLYDPMQTNHGVAINNTLDLVQEEYIVLLEDDFFILRHGVLSEAFRVIEEGRYDIVASPRGSCSFEIIDAARQLWGETDTGAGDNGPNFWPCAFFSKKQTLLDTDRNFDSRSWEAGEPVKPLGVHFDVEVRGDTFVNTSLQLRAKFPRNRILIVPQFHSYVTDIDDYHAGKYIFSGKAPWFHVGSLSSGISGVLMDNNGRALSRRFIEEPKERAILPPHCNTEQEKQEWQRRVAWWKTFVEEAHDVLPEFKQLYTDAVQRVINQYGLHLKTITIRQAIYKGIMRAYYD